MVEVKNRTTRRVAGRTRGIGPIVGTTKLKRRNNPKTDKTDVCPACGKNITRNLSGDLRAHKKYSGSMFNCPGFVRR